MLLLDIIKQALAFSVKTLQRRTSPSSFGLKPKRDQVDIIHLWGSVNPQQHPLKAIVDTSNTT
jgi:hypothetical protein